MQIHAHTYTLANIYRVQNGCSAWVGWLRIALNPQDVPECVLILTQWLQHQFITDSQTSIVFPPAACSVLIQGASSNAIFCLTSETSTLESLRVLLRVIKSCLLIIHNPSRRQKDGPPFIQYTERMSTIDFNDAFLPHSNGWLIQLLRIDKAASQSAKAGPSYRGFFLASTSTN